MKKILARLFGRNSKPGIAQARPLPIEIAKKASMIGQLQVYQLAWGELETNKPQAGLWARCYAEANGDMQLARNHYLKLRAPELQLKKTAKPVSKANQQTPRPGVKANPLSQSAAVPRQAATASRPLIPGKAKVNSPPPQPIPDAAFVHEEIELLPISTHTEWKAIEPEPIPFQAIEIEQPVSQKPQSAKQQKLLDLIAKVRKGGAGQVLSSEPESIDRWGCTRLMRVAQRGEYDALLQLLAEGDDPLVTDSSGLTARAHAEVQGNTSCAELLDAAEQVWEQQGRI